MSHTHVSFWFCTLFSGVVIGMAIDQLPRAFGPKPEFTPHSFTYYCHETDGRLFLKNQESTLPKSAARSSLTRSLNGSLDSRG